MLLGDRHDKWKQEAKQVEIKSAAEQMSHRGWGEHKYHIKYLTVTFQAKLSQFKLSFDRAATYVFPLLFLSFNIFYWAVYLLIMPAFIQVDRDRQK